MFWDDEDSANPDHEVRVALRATMASVSDAMLIALTSVSARRGEVWRMYERYFGRQVVDYLIVNGATTTMNLQLQKQLQLSELDRDRSASKSTKASSMVLSVKVNRFSNRCCCRFVSDNRCRTLNPSAKMGRTSPGYVSDPSVSQYYGICEKTN